MDLYRAKGKSKNKISFNDLTLHENLNYIKFNLKNSDEAFKMFEITKDKMENGDIPASIIQKLANRSDIKPSNVSEKLLEKKDYKDMLKAIQKHMNSMDNKQLVDTLFSIGRLHRKQTLEEL